MVAVKDNIKVHNAFTQGRSAGIRPIDPTNGGSATSRDTFASDTATFVADDTVMFPNKITNPLHQFSSFNSIFTLACLTIEEINFPARLRQRPPKVTILRSGGSGQSKYLTPYDLDFNGGTDVRNAREYFIENVNISTTIAPGKQGQSNVNTLDFTVYEPYSMGTFVETLRQSGIKAGYKNWVEAPWCLIIEFIGIDANNKMSQVKDSLGNNTKRIFPIKISDLQFTADQAGARYEIKAVPVNEIALNKGVQSIPNDITLRGMDVQSMLQGALQTELNKNKKSKNKDKKNKLAEIDDIIINFPKREQQQSLSQRTGYSDNAAGATFNPQEQRTELLGTGAQVVSTPHITQYEQARNTVNAIGLSKMTVTENQIKSVLSEDDKKFYDIKTKLGKTVKFNNKIAEIAFKQGAAISSIIENVILLSDYGKRLFEPSDENGFKTWFKIITRCFYINDEEILESNAKYPLLVVFDVIEHKVHESLLAKPNKKTNTQNFNKFIVKEYDYLFSGKNLDVLKFDLKILASFQQLLPSDKADSKEDPNRKARKEKDNSGGVDESAGDTAKGNVASGQASAGYYYSPRRKSMESLNELTTEQRQTLEFHDMIMSGSIAFSSVNIELLGDPYFLADSGTGNYYASVDKDPRTGDQKFINNDGSAEPTFNGIYCVINFKTPIDYAANGNMIFKGTANELNKNFVTLNEFSGVYRMTMVKNIFQSGTFTQDLQLVRVPNQEVEGAATKSIALTPEAKAGEIRDVNQGEIDFGSEN